MNRKVSKLRLYLHNRFIWFILILFFYTLISFALGSFLSRGSQLRLEIPLVLALYGIFYFLLRRNRIRAYLAAVPVLLIYILCDVYFLAFGRVLRMVEVKDLPEIYDVLPPLHIAVLFIVFVFPVVLFLYSIDFKNPKKILVAMCTGCFIFLIIKPYPNLYLRLFDLATEKIVTRSEKCWIEDNGRLAMMLYLEAKRNLAMEESAAYWDRDAYERERDGLAQFLAENGNGKNVHLVMMESLLDPTLLKGVEFSKNPYHPDFLALFPRKGCLSISPVFAAYSAQAEFEVLCGVPALRKLDSIDFNVFSGTDTYCLAGLLRKAGYRTIASNAYKVWFFNSFLAYKGIGFEEVYFPREYSGKGDSYISLGFSKSDEGYLFDGDLLRQNYRFLARSLKDRLGKPIFNYVVGMYGHYPFKMKENMRPMIIKLVSGTRDPVLQRQANQFYYRTEALARFVREIIRIDAKSIIIIISDHLPALGKDKADAYKRLRYLDGTEDALRANRIFIMQDGQPKRYDVISHYDLPAIIMNYITDGAYCAEYACEIGREEKEPTYYNQYMKIIAHAIK